MIVRRIAAGLRSLAARLEHVACAASQRRYPKESVAGNSADEMESLQKAVALAPNDPALRIDLGRSYRRQGINHEAIRCAHEALTLAPESSNAYDLLGDALYATGKFDDAIDALSQALVLDPGHVYAGQKLLRIVLTQRRDSLFGAGDYPGAVARHRQLRQTAGTGLAGRRIEVCPLSSVKDWCRSKKLPYRSIRQENDYRMAVPHFYGEPRVDAVTVRHPEVYVAELSDVSVIGGVSLVLAADGTALFDMGVHPEADERFDFRNEDTRGGVVQCSGNRRLLLDVPRRSGQTFDTAVMLAGTATYNYFHWIVECLPRLSLLEEFPEYANAPLLVDEACLRVPQWRDALSLFDQRKRRTLVLEPNCEYKVKRLVAPSPLAWVVINLKARVGQRYSDLLISPEDIQFLRRGIKLAGAASESGIPGKRFYISRKLQQLRRSNEEQMEAVFRRFGFEVVYPEKMSFPEQVKAFSAAEFIAGPNGSGLTNIIFAPASARILCMMGDRVENACLSNIADIIGQEIIYLQGDPVLDDLTDPLHRDFEMNPEYVANALSDLLRENL